MLTSSQFFKTAIEQLALEYGASPEAFMTEGFTLTLPVRPEGIRVYSHDMPFFGMASTGNSVVAMADERLHGFLRQLEQDARDHHRLFEYINLHKIDEKLRDYGYFIRGTVNCYLPGQLADIPVDGRFSLKWFEDREALSRFYPNEHFPMSLSHDYDPDRPDVIALAAYDNENDEIAAMAGASADTSVMWQVGIDVMPKYRSRGLGAALVSIISRRIMDMGKLPFYCTAVANVHSQSIAVKCGYIPAWVETITGRL